MLTMKFRHVNGNFTGMRQWLLLDPLNSAMESTKELIMQGSN